MNTIYTIGHSVHKADYFINLLKKHDIDLVLDVRSSPFSKHASQFNREIIQKELERNGIHYKFVGNTFGARQKDSSLYSDEGILDFDKVKKTDKFKECVEKVIEYINRANIVLMCSEKDPIDCHRSILLSKAFFDEDINIKHILENGEVETQLGLENRLLELYELPRKTQKTLDFFAKGDGEGFINHLQIAYKKRNKDIGYCIISK